jgi:hypothetical protein
LFGKPPESVKPSSVSLYHLNVWNSPRSKVYRINPRRMLSFLIECYNAEFSNSYWFGWEKIETLTKIMKAYTSFLQNAECFEIFAGNNQRNLCRTLRLAR